MKHGYEQRRYAGWQHIHAAVIQQQTAHMQVHSGLCVYTVFRHYTYAAVGLELTQMPLAPGQLQSLSGERAWTWNQAGERKSGRSSRDGISGSDCGTEERIFMGVAKRPAQEASLPIYPQINVSLDPDTAHPNLILSEDRRRVTWEEKPRDLPDDPQRFVSLPCVLGQQVISSGRRYWEVEVGDIGAWDLGICRDNVMRKGRVFLKPQDGFWAIRLYNNEYWALTSPETQLTPKKHPARVCIFLEYEDRRISFYNMTDKFHIHTFNQCLFYGSLRPFFRLWSADSGHLTICPVSETAQPDDDPHRVPTPVLGTSYNLPD
nr:butyrophilin subfamily 1 member A1-like [Loxodonta africana]